MRNSNPPEPAVTTRKDKRAGAPNGGGCLDRFEGFWQRKTAGRVVARFPQPIRADAGARIGAPHAR